MIHISHDHGWYEAIITDMTYAGKRGKECRVFSIQLNTSPHYTTTSGPAYDAYRASLDVIQFLDRLTRNKKTHLVAIDFEWVVSELGKIVSPGAIYPQPRSALRSIKAIHAPRPTLTAGINGVWSGSATEIGISLGDETDQNNLPAAITSRQSRAEAYRLAAKVWDRVKACLTFREAENVLSDAGCRLHYYCRMD